MGVIPQGEIFPIDGVSLVVDDAPHPWHRSNLPAIDRSWARESAERPFLFNGTVMLHRGLHLAEKHIAGVSHRVPFAALLHWLAQAPVTDDAWHLFGSAVIVSGDNALVLIRMGQRTANPGRICGPAGSLDLEDIAGGYCDLASNMVREVREETGLDLMQAASRSGYSAWRQGRRLVVFRRFYFNESAEKLAARVEAHIRADPEPEADAAVIIRQPSDAGASVPHYMKAIIEFHFSGNGRLS